MHKKHMLTKTDRSALRRLGIWVECMMLLAGSILLGILVLA